MRLSFEEKGKELHIRTDAEGAELASLLIRGSAGIALRLSAYDAEEAQRFAKELGPLIAREIASGTPVVDFTQDTGD